VKAPFFISKLLNHLFNFDYPKVQKAIRDFFIIIFICYLILVVICKMERDIIVERRVLSVNTKDRHGNDIWKILRRLIKKYDKPLHSFMDQYDIPEEIIT